MYIRNLFLNIKAFLTGDQNIRLAGPSMLVWVVALLYGWSGVIIGRTYLLPLNSRSDNIHTY